jgi:hypothetical protein
VKRKEKEKKKKKKNLQWPSLEYLLCSKVEIVRWGGPKAKNLKKRKRKRKKKKKK